MRWRCLDDFNLTVDLTLAGPRSNPLNTLPRLRKPASKEINKSQGLSDSPTVDVAKGCLRYCTR